MPSLPPESQEIQVPSLPNPLVSSISLLTKDLISRQFHLFHCVIGMILFCSCSLDCFKLHKTELCQTRQEQQGFKEDRQPTVAEASNTLDEQTLLIDEISEKNILDQSTLEKIGK